MSVLYTVLVTVPSCILNVFGAKYLWKSFKEKSMNVDSDLVLNPQKVLEQKMEQVNEQNEKDKKKLFKIFEKSCKNATVAHGKLSFSIGESNYSSDKRWVKGLVNSTITLEMAINVLRKKYGSLGYRFRYDHRRIYCEYTSKEFIDSENDRDEVP
jgi:hypothetical protein